MLEVDKLGFSYGAVRVLEDVSMGFPPGKITCIMGRNGVGKTTLIKNLTGILTPSSGRVALDGDDLTRVPPHRRARRGIGLVPQGREIFPKLTVMDNLRIGMQADPRRGKRVPEEVLSLFSILRPMAKRMGGDLSGGQQQQLALARALAGRPKVLLLDEPTEGIQPNIIQEIGSILRRLAAEGGLTVVLVEQYLDFVREIGDRFYIMSRGRVAAEGGCDELSDDLVARHLSV